MKSYLIIKKKIKQKIKIKHKIKQKKQINNKKKFWRYSNKINNMI